MVTYSSHLFAPRVRETTLCQTEETLNWWFVEARAEVDGFPYQLCAEREIALHSNERVQIT